MGTNYYLHEKVCPTCGRGEADPRHIGKSSSGWCFALHVIPAEGLNDLDDWVARWSLPDAAILDEYNRTVSTVEMFRIITERSHPPPPVDGRTAQERDQRVRYLRENYAEEGPNGLLRHSLMRGDMRDMKGRGAGTWDLLEGDFS